MHVSMFPSPETPLHFPHEAAQCSQKIKHANSRLTTPTQLQPTLISFLGIKLAPMAYSFRTSCRATRSLHSIVGANRLNSLCFYISEGKPGMIFSGYFSPLPDRQWSLGAVVSKPATSSCWFACSHHYGLEWWWSTTLIQPTPRVTH